MPDVFIWLSRLFDWFLEPLSWALLLAAAALFLRRRRLAWALAALAAVVLVMFSTDAVADAIQRAVERSARATYRADVVYDAVIVLGGLVDNSASRASGEVELLDAADRIVRGFELVRSGRARNILVSGGAVWPQPGDVPEADRLAAKLAEWGIPPGQIAVEATSRNTRENAIQSARMAAARGWRTLLLVTSAAHVPRALGCFRAVGLEPDVLPVDHRAGDGRGRSWLPHALALARSTTALREVGGRIAFRAAGYTR